MAELEELALDPLVPPEVVLGGESLDERRRLSADRRPSRPARIGPLPRDQAMPLLVICELLFRELGRGCMIGVCIRGPV
jgi:hypothetical protein